MSESGQTTANWAILPYHRRWPLNQADGLFDSFQYRLCT